MDDSELDRLFGNENGSDEALEEDKAVDAAPENKEKNSASDDNAGDEKPGKSEETEEAEETEENEETSGDPEEDENVTVEEEEGPDEPEDEEAGDGEDTGDEEEGSEDGSDEESGDEEGSEDKEKDGDKRRKRDRRGAAGEAAPGQKNPKRGKPQKKAAEVAPLSPKIVAAMVLIVVVVIMGIVIAFHPAFRVRNVHIEGNVALTEQEILQQCGLEYDAHLMRGVSGNILDVIRLDYGKTEKLIMKQNPYIEDIRISISLPSTVDIKIRERQKICYVKTADGYIALDKDGIVLEIASLDSKRTVQPVICGLNVKYAELGKPVVISNMNDYKKTIIVLGAILAADNASVGGDYSMFMNTSEVRILPSGYIFLTIYSAKGNLIQIKLNSLESISDDMAWLLYAFNSDAFDRVTVDGALDMTNDEYIFKEY